LTGGVREGAKGEPPVGLFSALFAARTRPPFPCFGLLNVVIL
jgi:hypothetical protein